MTTEIILHGSAIENEADFHDAIDRAARSAGFVGYGRNPDALWDVITAILPPPVDVRWHNVDACRDVLGNRLERIIAVFRDAERERGSSFRFTIEP